MSLRLSALTFALLSSLYGACATPRPTRPNVIVVMTDDQGYGDLGRHGHPFLKTPNLDRLHDESVRLTDFHVAPMCTPTRAQLMTGMDAMRTRAMNVSSGRALLRTDVPTAADIFAANGYRTAIFGKWHLGDNHPYRPHERGFHESLWFQSSHIGSSAGPWNDDCFDDTYVHNGKPRKVAGYCTDVFFAEAMAWMRRQRDRGAPFFLYLPTNSPHGPLCVPDKYAEPYRAHGDRLARFFGMIASVDENMGRLDAFLRKSKIYGDTIVVFLTDNGGAVGTEVHNAGMRGRKTELYEGGHRVPLFIRWPRGGLPPGDVRDLTRVQDLLPTLVDLAGLTDTRGARFDGINLAGRLRGREAPLPDRTFVIQYNRMGESAPRKGSTSVVLSQRWRLLEGKQLYDLARDPQQKVNVIEAHPGVAARLAAHYDAWWAGIVPEIERVEAVGIGSDQENPVRLTPAEWLDVPFDQGKRVREGDGRNGTWHVDVERAGTYELSLRRWPAETDLALGAPAPEYQATHGTFPAGRALPIAKARLRIGAVDQTQDAAPEARAVTFTVALDPGRTQIRTSFLDGDGKELAGAYYVYVRRL